MNNADAVLTCKVELKPEAVASLTAQYDAVVRERNTLYDILERNRASEVCRGCVIAVLPETGETFLLWGSYNVFGGTVTHWSLSRHDPRYGTDDTIEVMELTGAPCEVAA